MNNSALTVLVAGVIIVALALVFRFRQSLHLTIKGFGLNFAAEGKNAHSQSGAKIRVGNAATASGERAAAVGGDQTGDITTGDSTSAPAPEPLRGPKGKTGAPPASAKLSTASKQSAGNTAFASAVRSVAVGGDAKGNITTGDRRH